MLAITERYLLDAGLDWAFCDTDSMAFAMPVDMDSADFVRRVEGVCAWFEGLNPYAVKGSILEMEKQNRARVALSDGVSPTSPCFASPFQPNATPCSTSAMTAGRSYEKHPPTGSAISRPPTKPTVRPRSAVRRTRKTAASTNGRRMSGARSWKRRILKHLASLRRDGTPL